MTSAAVRLRPSIRLAGASLLALVCLVVFAGPAQAHAVLVETTPGFDEVVSEQPDRVVATFSEPVEINFGALRVFDSNGERVDTDDSDHVEGEPESIAVGLDAELADGTYTATYRVISADSHVIDGAFVFHVGAPGAQAEGIGDEVTATPDEGPAGGFFKTSFRVGHGCDGKPTTEMSMQVPGNVSSVHPQVVAGWDIETKMGELDEPIESHGETITEGVREITWTATDNGLPDAFMQEFGVSMALPDAEAGEPLWFPFVQECPGGDSHEWIEIPDSVEEWGDLESPAPYVVLTEGEGGHDDEEEADAEETAANGEGGAITEEQIRTIAAEEADDNSNILIALLGVILGAIGVAFGVTANMRARKAAK